MSGNRSRDYSAFERLEANWDLAREPDQKPRPRFIWSLTHAHHEPSLSDTRNASGRTMGTANAANTRRVFDAATAHRLVCAIQLSVGGERIGDTLGE
jgi:hypothetical protein